MGGASAESIFDPPGTGASAPESPFDPPRGCGGLRPPQESKKSLPPRAGEGEGGRGSGRMGVPQGKRIALRRRCVQPTLQVCISRCCRPATRPPAPGAAPAQRKFGRCRRSGRMGGGGLSAEAIESLGGAGLGALTRFPEGKRAAAFCGARGNAVGNPAIGRFTTRAPAGKSADRPQTVCLCRHYM